MLITSTLNRSVDNKHVNMRGQTACLDRYVQWSEIMPCAGKIDNDRLIGGGMGGGEGMNVVGGAGSGGGKQYQNISSWRQPPKVTRDAFRKRKKKKKKGGGGMPQRMCDGRKLRRELFRLALA